MELADAIEAFIAARKAVRRMKPPTERTYRHHFDHFARHIGPDRPIESITQAEIQAWMSTMGHLQESSLKTATEPVRGLFRWAVDEEEIDRDPTRKIPRPRLPGPTYRGLNEEVVTRLLHVADFRERTITLTALHLGLRCCEMERFDVQDWDRHERALYVRGKGGDGRVTRVLPVEGECEWVLNVWFDGRRTGPFLPSQHGDGLIANSISGIVTRLARRAGVRASHHKLRHTCAHHMLAMGSQQNAVQRFLGHRHSATTDIYTAARDADLRAVTSRSYIVGNVVDLGEAA